MIISDKIKFMRKQSGISMRQLAKKSNCAPSLISMVENGTRSLNQEMIRSIKKSYGL